MSDERRDYIAKLVVCRCDPAWTERRLHAPDCVEELGEEALEAIDAITAERDRLAEQVRQHEDERDKAKREAESLGRRLAVRYEEKYRAEAERDALREQVRQQQPVIDAAKEWRECWPGPYDGSSADVCALVDAVDALAVAQASDYVKHYYDHLLPAALPDVPTPERFPKIATWEGLPPDEVLVIAPPKRRKDETYEEYLARFNATKIVDVPTPTTEEK